MFLNDTYDTNPIKISLYPFVKQLLSSYETNS